MDTPSQASIPICLDIIKTQPNVVFQQKQALKHRHIRVNIHCPNRRGLYDRIYNEVNGLSRTSHSNTLTPDRPLINKTGQRLPHNLHLWLSPWLTCNRSPIYISPLRAHHSLEKIDAPKLVQKKGAGGTSKAQQKGLDFGDVVSGLKLSPPGLMYVRVCMCVWESACE